MATTARQVHPHYQVFGQAAQRAGAAVRSAAGYYSQQPFHKRGMEWTKGMYGIHGGFKNEMRSVFGRGMTGKARLGGAFKLGLRALGPVWVAHDMYHGYKEGGVSGAAKAGISVGVQAYVLGALFKPALALAPVAMAGAGYYAAGTLGTREMRRHERLEMGSPAHDPFGTAATMRQRSLEGIMRSHINGRSAFGNEASMTYRPYRVLR
jgi:hypothetical protein